MLQRAARRVLGNAAAAFDMAVSRTALSRSGQRQAEELRHEARVALLARLKKRYQAMGAASHFFREPRKIEPNLDARLTGPDGLRVLDLSWGSDYETFLPEIRSEYHREVENRTAAARLVTYADEPRPLAILVHGYLGGVHRTERRIWPMDFLRRIGMDVALFVLPFHGSRAAPRRFGEAPPFPGADPRFTNEGFRQAMGDLRDLIAWLYDRGHPSVGVMGMSLGGFSTALAATLEPKLRFAIPIIPLTSIADIARAQGRLGRTPRETESQYRAIDAVYNVTSPLHRTPAIPSENIFIIAGEKDQITPISHARKLAAHFHCRIETWPGGHLIQLGRGDKFRSIGRFLNEIGVVSRKDE